MSQSFRRFLFSATFFHSRRIICIIKNHSSQKTVLLNPSGLSIMTSGETNTYLSFRMPPMAFKHRPSSKYFFYNNAIKTQFSVLLEYFISSKVPCRMLHYLRPFLKQNDSYIEILIPVNCA